MNYYNEFDLAAAAQIQALMDAGLIPKGHIDTRSITDVKPHELKGFIQCHFFAGVSGWSLALQLAGWPADRPVWTGSCPCQPFSVAGKGRGSEDERHLWPAFFGLIRQCRPDTVFGEQVESAIRHGWLDGIRRDVEGEGYALGHVVLGAHSIGAPHLRQRLFWVADRLGSGLEGLSGHGGDSGEPRRVYSTQAGPAPASGPTGPVADVQRRPGPEHEHEPWFSARRKEATADGTKYRGDHGGLGNAKSDNEWWYRKLCESGGRSCPPGGSGDGGSRLGHSDSNGREPGLGASASARHGRSAEPDGFWSDAIWIRCVDGKHRRIPSQSIFQPVVNGLPYGLGDGLSKWSGEILQAAQGFPLAAKFPHWKEMLKGPGNAIVAQVTAEFIKAYL